MNYNYKTIKKEIGYMKKGYGSNICSNCVYFNRYTRSNCAHIEKSFDKTSNISPHGTCLKFIASPAIKLYGCD